MSSDHPAPEENRAASGTGASAALESRSESERLFREHNEALLNYAYARVHSWADAKDVVQEAYVKVFDLGRQRPIGHLRAYLYKTVRNCATDWVRQRTVRQNFAGLAYFHLEKETPSAEHVWLLRDEIERALEVLPPKARLAMILVNVRGLTCDEAAEYMRIKTTSVRRLLERAMEHLLESLKAETNERGGRHERL